jgi:hypothetical protein
MAVTILLKKPFSEAAAKGDFSAPELASIGSCVDTGARLEAVFPSSSEQDLTALFVLEGLNTPQEKTLVAGLQNNTAVQRAYVAPGRKGI